MESAQNLTLRNVGEGTKPLRDVTIIHVVRVREECSRCATVF